MLNFADQEMPEAAITNRDFLYARKCARALSRGAWLVVATADPNLTGWSRIDILDFAGNTVYSVFASDGVYASQRADDPTTLTKHQSVLAAINAFRHSVALERSVGKALTF
jgi:hypothetical protein